MRYWISITWISLLIAGLRYRLRLAQDLIQRGQRDCRGQAHGTPQSASALAGSPAWQLDAARSARTPSSSDGSASGPGLPDSAGAIRRCHQISAPFGRQRGRDVVVDHNHLDAPSRLVRRRTSSPVPTSRSSRRRSLAATTEFGDFATDGRTARAGRALLHTVLQRCQRLSRSSSAARSADSDMSQAGAVAAHRSAKPSVSVREDGQAGDPGRWCRRPVARSADRCGRGRRTRVLAAAPGNRRGVPRPTGPAWPVCRYCGG